MAAAADNAAETESDEPFSPGHTGQPGFVLSGESEDAVDPFSIVGCRFFPFSLVSVGAIGGFFVRFFRGNLPPSIFIV
jgi:hypothetical protein